MAPIPKTPDWIKSNRMYARFKLYEDCHDKNHVFDVHPKVGDPCLCRRQKLTIYSVNFIKNCPDKINGDCHHEIN